MDQQLDIQIEGLPSSLQNSFIYAIDGKLFRYDILVDEIRFLSSNSIYCAARIRKFKQMGFLPWVAWKNVWSFSEFCLEIIGWSGKVSNSHRNSLITKAINESVSLTDLLLDQLLLPIENRLQAEWKRIMSLRKGQGTQSQSDQDIASGQQ